MDWLKRYADIPEAERIRRIAALDATAVARHQVAPRPEEAVRPGEPGAQQEGGSGAGGAARVEPLAFRG